MILSLCNPVKRILSDLLMMAERRNNTLEQQIESDSILTSSGEVNTTVTVRVENSEGNNFGCLFQSNSNS